MSNSVDGGEIVIEMRADGSQLQEEIKKTQDALNNLGAQSSDTENSLGGIARASKKTQVDLKGIGDASKRTNIDLKGMSGEGISALSAGLSTVNPKAGALVGLFGQLRILSGPLAIALTAAAAAVKLYSDELERQERVTDQNTDVMNALIDVQGRLKNSIEQLSIATGDLTDDELELLRARQQNFTQSLPGIQKTAAALFEERNRAAELKDQILELEEKTGGAAAVAGDFGGSLSRSAIATTNLSAQLKKAQAELSSSETRIENLTEAQTTQISSLEQIIENTSKRITADQQAAGAAKEQAEADREAGDAAKYRAERNSELLDHLKNNLAEVASESSAIMDKTIADLDKALTEVEQATIRDQEAIGQGISDTLTGVSSLSMTLASQVSEDNKKAAMALFRTSQAAGLADVAINTAVAITKALAQLGPVAGAVSTIGLAATGAAQTAAILAQKPPTAHVGTGLPGSSDSLAPDERLSFGRRVLRTESSQPAGVANSMGTQLINDVNTGRLGGGGGGQITAVIGRTHLDTELFQSGRRGTSRFSRMLRTNPHPNPQGGY